METKRKILVVDDMEINRLVLCEMLKNNYELLTAGSGESALEIIRTAGSLISAVILDIVMPGMSGYEVLSVMNADTVMRRIPVVVISQDTSSEREIRALVSGASDFIPKPFVREVILARVAKAIETGEMMRSTEAAGRDKLTGLLNQEAFVQTVRGTLDKADGEQYDMMVVDVEEFKLIKNTVGVHESERLLVTIARETEMLVDGTGAAVAHSSGDLFYIFARRDCDLRSTVAERLPALIESCKPAMRINLKFGIFEIDDPQLSVTMMCDRAVLAVNSIKGKYSQSCIKYNDELYRAMEREKRIVDGLPAALANDDIKVYLQPKYDLQNELIAGAEALVRWTHPTLGIVSPSEFIPIFENNGFITELDRYVWDKTCGIIEGWMRDIGKTVPVSVNISRKDMCNEDLPELMHEIVKKHGLDTSHLHLEITETAYTENQEQLVKVVSRLKALGFTIEMDDFGTGYSSLNMISELPIDVLKLDMRFIQNKSGESDNNILNFVIGLAKWMNLLIVAEGVETAEQVELLRSLDCNYIQGYYYYRPMPAEEFTKMIAEGEVAQSAAADIGKPAVNAAAGSRVLVIADPEKENRTLLASYFGELYTIIEAASPSAAFEAVRRNFDSVAAVILDCSADSEGAIRILKALKTNVRFSDIPIIATGNSSDKQEPVLLSLGASDFITRPYNRETVRPRVRNAVNDSQSLLQREQELKKKILAIENVMRLDPMTGLFNRAEMEKQVKEFFIKKPDGKGLFAILDIDNFKEVNDRFGHIAGDDAIKSVAELLRTILGEGETVCRMGGDEFQIFIRGEMSPSEVEKWLSKLLSKLCFRYNEMTISCSIGAAICPDGGSSYKTLYKSADRALIAAKRYGKMQFCIYSETLEVPAYAGIRGGNWLLDEMSDAVFVCDDDTGKILYINDSAARLAGKNKKECLGTPCYETMWNRDKPCDGCGKSIQVGGPEFRTTDVGCEYRLLIKRIKWGESTAKMHHLQDITPHRALPENLDKPHGESPVRLNDADCGVILRDANGELIKGNDRYFADIGYTHGELCDLSGSYAPIVPEEREAVREYVGEQIEKFLPYSLIYRIAHKDGEVVLLSESGRPYCGDDGKVYVFAIVQRADRKTPPSVTTGDGSPRS